MLSATKLRKMVEVSNARLDAQRRAMVSAAAAADRRWIDDTADAVEQALSKAARAGERSCIVARLRPNVDCVVPSVKPSINGFGIDYDMPKLANLRGRGLALWTKLQRRMEKLAADDRPLYSVKAIPSGVTCAAVSRWDIVLTASW